MEYRGTTPMAMAYTSAPSSSSIAMHRKRQDCPNINEYFLSAFDLLRLLGSFPSLSNAVLGHSTVETRVAITQAVLIATNGRVESLKGIALVDSHVTEKSSFDHANAHREVTRVD